LRRDYNSHKVLRLPPKSNNEVAVISSEPGTIRPQLDWLTTTPTAPQSRTLHRYQRMNRWPLGKRRFARTAAARIPMLANLRARFQELRVGLCRLAMNTHRRVRAIDGLIDPAAVSALAQLAACMVIEVSLPAGFDWATRGITIEYLQDAREQAVALARLDRIDWSQAGAVGVPVTVSDGQGTEVARAVVSFVVSLARAERSG
jgi:acyl-coenzyme A thioesterase PaaI-like protein